MKASNYSNKCSYKDCQILVNNSSKLKRYFNKETRTFKLISKYIIHLAKNKRILNKTSI
jgi:hypothetical protein